MERFSTNVMERFSTNVMNQNRFSNQKVYFFKIRLVWEEEKDRLIILFPHPPHSARAVFSHFSHVQLLGILWTIVCQAPLPMGFLRQEYWGGLLFPPPGDLPNPGIEHTFPESPTLQAFAFTLHLPLSHPRGPLRKTLK